MNRGRRAVRRSAEIVEYPAAPAASSGVHELAGDDQRTDPFSRYVLSELDFLLRVARSITGNATDAEDLVQDTLLSAYRGIGGFDGAHPRAWLCTVMRHAESKRHRRRRPELLRGPDADTPSGRNAVTPTSASAEQLVLEREFDATVARCLAALPDRHRQLVELVDIDDLSYAEAAELLGVPVGTVMSRLHRARARIRQRLTAAGLAPKASMR